MWNVDGLVYWRIYASLGLNKLNGVCWLIFLTSIQFVERVPVMRQQSTINQLTHWGRMTHICVNKLTIIGSDNGLAPGRRRTIIWTNDGILLIGPLGTNFSEILIGIQTFSFKKMRLKISSAKWRPFCLGLNVIIKTMCPTTSHNSPEQTHGSLHRYATLSGLLHTVKPVYNDHLMGYLSAFWSSSRWPRPT